MTRAAVATNVGDEVLIRSRRRCCLCYFLDGDATQKQGQLAHVDRDSSNSSADNLAYLCLRHHNYYDTRQSQGKNPTPGELLHAREALYEAMRSQPSADIRITIELNQDYDTFTDSDQSRVIEMIRKEIPGNAEVRLISRERGSVRLKFEMPSDQAARLLKAIGSGRLGDMNIVEVDMDQLFEPDTICHPQWKLDDISRLDLPVELLKEDRQLLVFLTLSAFDLSPVDVRKNAKLAVALGAAEELRLITAFGHLLDAVLNALQHVSQDLLTDSAIDDSEFDRIVSTIGSAIDEYRAASEDIRGRTRLYAERRAIWDKLQSVVSQTDEALSELQRAYLAEAEDRRSTPEVRAVVREHVDHAIHELMHSRMLLGEEHGECMDALIRLVTLNELAEEPEVETDQELGLPPHRDSLVPPMSSDSSLPPIDTGRRGMQIDSASAHRGEIERFFAEDVATLTRQLADIAKDVESRQRPQDDEEYRRLCNAISKCLYACVRFEDIIRDDQDLLKDAQTRFREAIAPWFDQSWLYERAKTKPRGYPGDHVIRTGIYDQRSDAPGIGGYLNLYFLSTILARAVVARLKAARAFLVEELAQRQGDVNILNVACGPCREYLNGLEHPDACTPHVTCIDSDQDALDYVTKTVVSAGGKALDIRCIRYNALRMSSAKANIRMFGKSDIIYSIGLLDYIPDDYLVAILSGLRESLAEDGVLYAAFKDSERYETPDYQWVCDWYFFQRTEQQCRSLYERAGFNMDGIQMTRDETGAVMNFVSRMKPPAVYRVDAPEAAAEPRPASATGQTKKAARD